MSKSKVLRLLVMIGPALALTCLAVALRAAEEPAPAADGERIAALVRELETMSPERLRTLEPVDIRPWQLPGPGVDVMRARLEETYAIDGVGEDTVELTGWIAVRHGEPRPARGETDLTWNTAVLDTEFVGLELTGHSDVFGPVEIRLDTSREWRGQVGRIEIPELARVALLARLDKDEAQEGGGQEKAVQPAARQPVFKIDGTRVIRREIQQIKPIDVQRLQGVDLDVLQVGACAAPIGIEIQMKELGLHMKTEGQTVWYSLVDTIPPVGHTASITIEPVRLVADGRGVGTLKSGIVKFREVVRHLPLSSEGDRLAGGAR